MDTAVPRNIVVSAVNLRKGGTLTVLRDCLRYLSARQDLHVTALVHKRELADYPGIHYIEIPWSIRSWVHRLWCEYITMHRISKELPETDLWLSLHDTTPRVGARRQAVYCHTSFPFFRTTWQDWKMDRKIVLFSRFTRYAYQWNVRRNNFLIVQQKWMRHAMAKMLHFQIGNIIVAPPSFTLRPISEASVKPPVFLYVGTSDCHKNFETLCEAARILEGRVGTGKFRVVITVKGDENRYARWLHRRFGTCDSIEFHGFMTREELYASYGSATCLVFPSRAETWGLPISEFLPTGKPMILADLPYAHETASGADRVAFFPVSDAAVLADRMREVMENRLDAFAKVPHLEPDPPCARDWDALFELLLS